MPYLAWLVALLPLACGCARCDWSWVCFGAAALLAAGLHFVLALALELTASLSLLKR